MPNIYELEKFHSDLVKKDREAFLKKEAKKVIKILKRKNTLKINRHIIFLKSCLRELGKTIDYNQFDQLLLEYRK
ncbi:MAG: hypothetical protein ACFFKA_10565 [Candidatus Thorarchaeota archaeon]|jgi:hypothetical protein